MLQQMRDLSKSWVFKGLLVLLVVSFGIWGIGDMFRGNPLQRTVAKVGKIAITVQALEREFQAGLPEARRVFGPNLTVPEARRIGVLDRTLNIMIEHASFDQEIKRLGINVNDKPILEKVAAQPELRDKDGKFNARLWQQLLAKSGYTERSFLETERRNAARRLLLNTMLNDVDPPKTLLDNLYMARGAKRILEVLTINNDSMKDLDPPDEDILREFHKQHSEMFSAPEYRSLTIARLAGEDLAKDISVSDEEIKKAYESRPGEMTLPERRDFVQVILQDETKAKALAETAKASGDLTKTAKAQGFTAVELKGMDEKSIIPDLYASFFSLMENDVSEPVKSNFGWHVAQLKKIHPGGKLSLEEAKEKLRAELQQEKLADMLARKVNQLDDSLAAATTLEDIADSLKLRLEKIKAVDKKGIDPDGKKPLETVQGNEDLLEAAFELAAGETSQVIDDKHGGYAVVRVDEIEPAHVVPFDDIIKEVFEAWKKTQKAQLAAAKAEEIAKEMRDGAKAVSYASKPGIDVRFSRPISLLGEADPFLPVDAYEKILLMKKGDVITASGHDKHFVLRLADIAAVDPAKPDSGMAKVAADLRERRQYELVEEYSKFLRRRFPVKINGELLDSLRQQGS